jgi:thioredoxin-like negative regulator of GroEL
MLFPHFPLFKRNQTRSIPLSYLHSTALIMALATFFLASMAQMSASASTPNLPNELKTNAKGRMVLLDFYSAFCGTCQMMEPHLKALQTKVSRNVLVERVDLDKKGGEKYESLFTIQGTPTYVLFDTQGKPIYRMGDAIAPMVLERQVLRLSGQLKTVNIPSDFPLPKPAIQNDNPLGQMILLSFESASCQECQSMTPYLQGFELAETHGLQVVHLNTETIAGKKLMQDWSVKKLPAYFLLDNRASNQPINQADGSQAQSNNTRPELFHVSGAMDPRMLWEVIRMFGDSGV